MSVKANLLRTAVELGLYAAERHAGFEQHQGSTARLPEAREQWIRGILQGMAEVTGTEPDRLTAAFDQQLEEGKGRFAVVPLPLSGQRHIVQTLRWYADDLKGYEGDQRARVMEVKNLLEDFTAYPSWDISNTHVPAARYETEMHLLRMTAQRPIRFTRVVVGGDLEPGGIEFMPGLVDDAAGVRRTETFQETVKKHPERTEWAALCTVYLGGSQQWAISTVDADELDMAIIREAGDQFLRRPGVMAVSHRELCVPVHEFLDMDDGLRKMVHVVRSLEDTPPDFHTDLAVEVNGMFVCCPKDAEAGKVPKAPAKSQNRIKKKKKEEIKR